MKALRTPDECFAGLTDFPFAPHYVDVDDCEGGSLRVHYIDEGPVDGPIVLLMHGEPTWSYLYRKMIAVLVDQGIRCIAPDLVGFGRSDKPTEQADYTYARHVGWMAEALFDKLDLQHITLFAQDWGGLVGLRLVGENPDRFSRVVIGNTGLPTGDRPPNEAFVAWRTFSRESPAFPIGKIISGGCFTAPDSETVAAYDAPFPDDSFKAGARIFPSLVPSSPDDPAAGANSAAWQVLRSFTRPFLCTFSDSDPITAGGQRAFVGSVPGAEGQPHTTIVNAGHFLQEDQGPQLAEIIAQFIAANP
jgi:haloalkane dehalogenase